MLVLSDVKTQLWRKLGLLEPSFEETIKPLVSSQATTISNSHTCRTTDKALFIDMGSNLGQGFSFFSEFYSPNTFDYWLIEANPFCIDPLKTNVLNLYRKHSWRGEWEIINKAVSSENGTLKLYGLVEDERGNTSVGASVIKDHNSVWYNSSESQALEVQTVRVSELIEKASKKYATIVVKMDIEASEYDALDDLIQTNFIHKIDHIYVEWHSQFFSAEKLGNIRLRENKLKAFLSSKLTDWH